MIKTTDKDLHQCLVHSVYHHCQSPAFLLATADEVSDCAQCGGDDGTNLDEKHQAVSESLGGMLGVKPLYQHYSQSMTLEMVEEVVKVADATSKQIPPQPLNALVVYAATHNDAPPISSSLLNHVFSYQRIFTSLICADM